MTGSISRKALVSADSLSFRQIRALRRPASRSGPAAAFVLNNAPGSTISEKTRQRLLQAARELGYNGADVTPKLCFIMYGRVPDAPRYMYDLATIEQAASRR
ncbi:MULTISPECIES: LacI family DNA-binding transcriptional regulator [Paenibacillus]|uniref:LacI family DNA-binding transcriptional regulator n=1 Tax=Paenibacillus TaxID=44249 RepID=UPI001ABFCDB6|nr:MULTISPECIES: LacI family DNA-binding transcriptional regulator [Paenibacillus]UYO04988.1 LacI family DNA-binding transcriptional regulator [Paenibacillus sp. PSB04]